MRVIPRGAGGEEQAGMLLGGLMAACVRECTDEAQNWRAERLKGFHRARNAEAVDDSRTQFTPDIFYTAPERRLMYECDFHCLHACNLHLIFPLRDTHGESGKCFATGATL